jgi:hypothetical protein
MIGARFLANLVLALHFAYVACVVLGFAAIVIGLALRKQWARSFWVRIGHLGMIAIVVLQAWLGVICPLTMLENRLRRLAGQKPYELDFIESWLHRFLFVRAPAWIFVLVYSVFGLAVLATFVWAPPHWPKRKVVRP